MTRRVGLLGGTFDPPHLAHLVVAEHALVLLGLDEVRLLVAGEPWMKDEIMPAAHRVAMAELAVIDHDQLLVDGRETRRAGPTYTAQTLADLSVEEPDVTFSFLLGADAAARISQWHRAGEALALARFVAVTRPGHTPDPSVDMGQLEVPLLAISSTDLRARYRDGRPTRWLLPDAVDRYAREHDLYGRDSRRAAP